LENYFTGGLLINEGAATKYRNYVPNPTYTYRVERDGALESTPSTGSFSVANKG
jgi:hypothetical protein